MMDRPAEQRFVYFIRPVGQYGPVKIGCSSVPESRLDSLAAWSPVALEIVTTAPGSFGEELRLHNAFASDHSHKEWFHYTPRLGEVMERIIQGESLDSVLDSLKPTGRIRSKTHQVTWSEGRKAYMGWLARLRGARRRAKEQRGGEQLWTPPHIDRLVQRFFDENRQPTPEEVAMMREVYDNPVAHFMTREERWPAKEAA